VTGRARTEPTSRRRAPSRRIPTSTAAATLDVDALIDDPATRIIVCCGSGGVGKTTTAAALGLRAAERGRKVVVLTIDPARRLAQSMGLTELDNVPRPVQGTVGELDAMMLDMKRTFDEVVEAHASPDRAAQILANPFYVALSSSFAGTQEYMAMEKLGQLSADADKSGRWDLIVVDTPPVALRPGLPRRAGAPVLASGRPLHQAAAGPCPRPRPAVLRRLRRGDRSAEQGAGLAGAA
jgi:Mrp family chromosome partitioning ATPase